MGHQVKLVVVGDNYSMGADQFGESYSAIIALLLRYTDKYFSMEYVPSIFDTYETNVQVDGENVYLGLWYTYDAGFDRLRPLSYPQTDVFVVAFSLISPFSLNNAEGKWFPELNHHAHGVPIVLIGLHANLRDDPEVVSKLSAKGKMPITSEEGASVAQRLGACKYMECSSRTGAGVDQAFDEAIRAALAYKQFPPPVAVSAKPSTLFDRFIGRKPRSPSVTKEVKESKETMRARSLLAHALADGEASAPWLRSKLMVTGQGRAGKTSTINALLRRPFNKSEISTDGVDDLGSFALTRTDRVVEWEQKASGDELKTAVSRRVALDISKTPKQSARPPQTKQQRSNLPLSAPSSSSSSPVMVPPSPAASVSPPAANRQTDEAEITRLFDAKLISEETKGASLSLSIWDYGGQHVFRAMQHYVITKHGAFLVVFDMERILGAARDETVADLRYWLNTIHLHAPDAAILLVGTRKDVVRTAKDHRIIDSTVLEDGLRSILALVSRQLRPNKTDKLRFFPVDNTRGIPGDPTLVALRQSILNAVMDEEHVTREIPLSWIRSCDALMELRAKHKRKHLSLDEARQVCVAAGAKSEAVTEMLTVFHELGVFVYLEPTPELLRLGSRVILEPQWALDAFAAIIRDRRVDMHGPSVMERTFQGKHDQALRELSSHALLSKSLLFDLWADLEPLGQTQVRMYLLDVMHDQSLLCGWRRDEERRADMFLVPCLLDLDPQMATLDVAPSSSIAMEACFEFDFTDSYLPTDLFARLVALAVQYTFTMDTWMERSADGKIVLIPISREPYLTKSLAVMSFARALFQMQERHGERIIVSVQKRKDAAFVLTRLESMMEKLSDDIARNALRYEIVLYSTDDKSRMPLTQAKSLAGEELRPFIHFFENTGIVQQTPAVVVAKESKYDVFLSHYQATGGDQCEILRTRLAERGFRAWLDMQYDGQITKDSMEAGVEDSRGYLLFLSRDVLKRPYVQMELNRSLCLGKPIVLLHETDEQKDSYSPFAGYIADYAAFQTQFPTHAGFKLFANVESIPFQRRRYLQDAIIEEIIKRINEFPS